jgi:hypothetical protein
MLAVNLIPRHIIGIIMQWLVVVFEGTILIGKTVNGGNVPWLRPELLTPSSCKCGWSYAGLVIWWRGHGTGSI